MYVLKKQAGELIEPKWQKFNMTTDSSLTKHSQVTSISLCLHTARLKSPVNIVNRNDLLSSQEALLTLMVSLSFPPCSHETHMANSYLFFRIGSAPSFHNLCDILSNPLTKSSDVYAFQTRFHQIPLGSNTKRSLCLLTVKAFLWFKMESF